MKVKTSIRLSSAAFEALERFAANGSSGSRVIEEVILEYVARRRQAARDTQDLRIINERADDLNREMTDVLERGEARFDQCWSARDDEDTPDMRRTNACTS